MHDFYLLCIIVSFAEVTDLNSSSDTIYCNYVLIITLNLKQNFELWKVNQVENARWLPLCDNEKRFCSHISKNTYCLFTHTH